MDARLLLSQRLPRHALRRRPKRWASTMTANSSISPGPLHFLRLFRPVYEPRLGAPEPHSMVVDGQPHVRHQVPCEHTSAC